MSFYLASRKNRARLSISVLFRPDTAQNVNPDPLEHRRQAGGQGDGRPTPRRQRERIRRPRRLAHRRANAPLQIFRRRELERCGAQRGAQRVVPLQGRAAVAALA